MTGLSTVRVISLTFVDLNISGFEPEVHQERPATPLGDFYCDNRPKYELALFGLARDLTVARPWRHYALYKACNECSIHIFAPLESASQ